jgi:hypothetical protein
MARGASPELPSLVHKGGEKPQQGSDILDGALEKRKRANATKDALTSSIGLMTGTTNRTGWSAERQAAYNNLLGMQTNIQNNELRVERNLSITDKNGRQIDKKVSEGIPANELTTFLREVANDPSNPNHEVAQQNLTILEAQTRKSVDLEGERFPQDKDEWVAERIKKEVTARTAPGDPRGELSPGVPKPLPQIEAEARDAITNQLEIISPELSPEEEKAVVEHEEEQKRTEDAAILANVDPELSRLLIFGLAKKKNANDILVERINRITASGSTATNEQKAQALDVLRTLYFLEKTNLVDKNHKKDRTRIEFLNLQIKHLGHGVDDLTNRVGVDKPSIRVASAVARSWDAGRFYRAEDIAEGPDRVLEDYFKKVIANESRPAYDDEGLVRQFNMRDVFLDQLKRKTFLNNAGLPENATEDQINSLDSDTRARAQQIAEKTTIQTRRKLKVENTKAKLLGARGPGALIALMMLGKSLKGILGVLTEGPQQAGQGGF